MALHEIQQGDMRQAYTEDDFMRGYPEALLQAEDDPRILTLWPHADETLGARVGHHIYSQRPDLHDNVDYLCGNPAAARQEPQPRYTQGIMKGYGKTGTDLNRSFVPGVQPKSYEEHRAAEILHLIEERGYNYVLDLHTSTVNVDGCFLISEAFEGDPAVRRMIAASPIDKVVVLPESIATWGLIGNVHNSVSIEYEKGKAAAVGVEETMTMIDGLVAGRSLVGPKERAFYYVSHPIPKTEDPGEEARNFELSAAGYYPVLFGENSYRKDPTKTYLGFAATRRTIETI